MKAQFTFLVLFFALTNFAQTKKVAINVAVLGTKHPTVRYYHPIDGVYKIYSKIVSFKKSDLKGLSQFKLIQPALFLHDSTNIIHANSLRHYVDPKELVYVNWKMSSDNSNNLKLDSFTIEAQNIRNEKYESIVQDYFNPFFISKYEVTNQEYREFTEWVRDSIFREAIYASDSLTNEQAFKMLKIEEEDYFNEAKMEWELVKDGSRSMMRELYSLNYEFDYRKEFRDDLIIPILSQFYLRPNERFYKRPSLDQSKLNYQYYSMDFKAIANTEYKEPTKKKQNSVIRSHRDLTPFIIKHKLNIYPDTTCWQDLDQTQFSDATGNIYFWHPAFNHMPVVGVSHSQAEAYCDWKQKQLQKSNPNISHKFTVSLPNLIEYEWAITSGYNQNIAAQIEDNQITSDLILGDNSETERPTNFSYAKSILQKVNLPYNSQNINAHRKFLKMIKKRYSKDYPEIFGSKHDVIMRAQGNYLASQVEFLSNNASEWMNEDYQTHYQALIEAYINYNCFADPSYCENQRNIDQNLNRSNDTDGQLIMGANWYDERYGQFAGVNKAGLYAKAFKTNSKSYATVGFRLVLRMNPSKRNYYRQ